MGGSSGGFDDYAEHPGYGYGGSYGRLENLQSQTDAINALFYGAGSAEQNAGYDWGKLGRNPSVPPQYITDWGNLGLTLGQPPVASGPIRQDNGKGMSMGPGTYSTPASVQNAPISSPMVQKVLREAVQPTPVNKLR